MRKLIAITLGVVLAGTATVALAGRDSSGTFTFSGVAGGYPFQPGVISRSAMNAHFSELSAELTDSASRSGKGGFTAPVRAADGSASAPAFSWTSDTNTGVYRIGADNIGIATGGTKRIDVGNAGVSFADPVSFAGSTTTSGVARFNVEAVFLSSVTVRTPSAGTDAANKSYVDTKDQAYADADVAWTSVPSSDYGTNWSGTVECATLKGIVFFRGVATAAGGCNNTTAFTVPVVCRPSTNRYFPAVDATGVLYPATIDPTTMRIAAGTYTCGRAYPLDLAVPK